MQSITLKDGTELSNSYVIQDGHNLYVYISNGLSFKQVFGLLSETERTEKIEKTTLSGTIETYTDYTDLIALRNEGNGLITAVLAKI